MALTRYEKEFWETLKYPYYVTSIDNELDLLNAIMYLKKTNTYPDCLGPYLLELAKRVGTQKQFINLLNIDDLIATAALQMAKHITNFTENKGTSPYAFLVAICGSAFMSELSRERKQQIILVELVQSQ